MNNEYKGAIQEKRFEYKGFPCVVVMQALGFRTGYVGLPKNNALYGIDYADIDISCHGGLTYSANHLVDQNDTDTWWIGFDTGHYMDGKDYDKAIELFKDYPKTINEILLMKDLDSRFNIEEYETARSLEYVENELKGIVDQIAR